MENLSNVNLVKKIISENDFKFSKSLGQNFIIDATVCPKMASFCNDCDGVIEVGPGIGTLTEILAKNFKKVVSVEIDKRLIPILSNNLSQYDNVKILNNDILKTNLNEIIEKYFSDCKKVCICANLPYYITSQVIMYILENEFKIDSIVVMVQKEAAQRICAAPASKDVGAISIAIRYFGEPKILFDVNKTCFIPVPKVDSSVIKIQIKKNGENIQDKKMFFRVLKASFSKRRKNLMNSLSQGLEITKDKIGKILDTLKINRNFRAENLKFEDFVDISNEIYNKNNHV